MAPTLEHRPIDPADGPALHAILRDPEVAKWLRPKGVTGPFSPAECDALAARHAAHHATHGFGLWLVTLGGEPVARAGAQHTLVDGRSEVELAWTVARAHWGTGIATTLARQALELTRSRGIREVVAFTRTDNAASRRVMEKSGLHFEREFEHAGLPHVVYREPSASIRPISS